MATLVHQLLLTLGLAIVVFLALLRRNTARHSHRSATRRRLSIVVTDPRVVRATLIDHADAFSNRPTSQFPVFSGTHSINSVPYGPMWRALRSNLTADIFHPTRLRLLETPQQEEIEALIAGLHSTRGAGGGDVVVRDGLHAAMFALSVRMCFGYGVGERYVRAMEREVLQFASTFAQDTAFFQHSSRMTRLFHWRRWLCYSGRFSRMCKLILPIIAARQVSRSTHAHGGSSGIPSYVDSLIDLRVPDNNNNDDATTTTGRKRPLKEKEMVRLVFEFLGANTESITACVEWTLAHLVIQPEVQKKLRREIITNNIQREKSVQVVSRETLRRLPYLRAVMLESLRLHPPVPLMFRDVSAKDAVVCGGVPAASSPDSAPVLVVADARKIGRNRQVWKDADEFRPERFLPGGDAEDVGPVPGPKDIRMVPFGAGRRYCPGAGLALVHVGCFLTALVREFDWALPADAPAVDLTEFRGFFMKMKTPLRARITPRPLPSM